MTSWRYSHELKITIWINKPFFYPVNIQKSKPNLTLWIILCIIHVYSIILGFLGNSTTTSNVPIVYTNTSKTIVFLVAKLLLDYMHVCLFVLNCVVLLYFVFILPLNRGISCTICVVNIHLNIVLINVNIV